MSVPSTTATASVGTLSEPPPHAVAPSAAVARTSKSPKVIRGAVIESPSLIAERVLGTGCGLSSKTLECTGPKGKPRLRGQTGLDCSNGLDSPVPAPVGRMRGVEMAARVVGYVRVSRVGGREGDSFISPPLQREQIEAVARREGLEVVEVLEELDASGGDNTRPLWNRAIEMVESGEVAGIAVWNLSRFSRSTRDFLNAWDRIEQAGGQVYSATENLDHKLLRTILVAVAEAERDRAAE